VTVSRINLQFNQQHQFDADCEADTSTTVAPPPCDNKTDDSKLKVIGIKVKITLSVYHLVLKMTY